MFTDVHAHLHVRNFELDREEVIERARQAGVTKMINVGFDSEGNFQALALAKKYDFIWATMGIHPHLASEWNEYVAEKIESAVKKEERIVALGEIGLDYFKNFQPKELQKEVLRAQLQLARKLDMPVIIHCRDAFDDCLTLLQEEQIAKALFHCFTGDQLVARRVWDRGYYTSFTGIITYPNAGVIRSAVQEAPIDRILIETDCPYLAPQQYRGKRNEPAFVVEIAKKIATLKGVELTTLAQQIEHNVQAFFGI